MMSTEQLEKRLAEVEQKLDAVIQRLDALPTKPAKKGILSIVGTMADDPDFDAAMAYGRYYRKTGKEPPPDWKPGDPIPEPEFPEYDE
jgi:hypothetical protein